LHHLLFCKSTHILCDFFQPEAISENNLNDHDLQTVPFDWWIDVVSSIKAFVFHPVGKSYVTIKLSFILNLN